MQQPTENRAVFSFSKITRIIITLSLILTSLELPASAEIYAHQTKAAAVTAGIDPTFAPRIEQHGYVNRAIPQPDGKTVVIGRFDKINNIERKDIIRLNADNTPDNSFNLPENFYGNYLELLPDGRFIAVNTDGAIVRLNSDGSLDYSFNFARTLYNVNTLKFKARSDGKVFVYGRFKVRKGRNLEIAENLIVLDEIGGIEAGYTIGDLGQITDVTFLPNGKTAVCGLFEVKSGGVTIGRNFAVLDENGLIDPSFNVVFPAVNDFNVKSAAVQPDGKLLVYGNFRGAYKQNGLRRIVSKNNGILRLNADGTFDGDFSVPFASANVTRTIVQPDGRILLFGWLQTSAGADFKLLSRLYPDGSLDTSFNDNMPLTMAYVWSVTSEARLLPDGKILVAGLYRVNNQPNVEKLVRLNADGTHDASFQTGTIVGGDPNGFHHLADGKLLIYGNFGKIGSRTRIGLARLNANGATDETFRGDAVRFDDVEVKALKQQADGKIIIAGQFTVVGGEYIYNAEQVSNVSIPSLNPVVRLNQDGSLDNSFAPLTNVFEDIYTVALQPDGKILVGGIIASSFSTYVVRLNQNGTIDAGFNRVRFFHTSGFPVISDLAVQADGKILIVGYFERTEDLIRQKVARLNADGSLDQDFIYNGYFFHSDVISKIVLQPDGKILIGGDPLGTAENAPGLGRFNADGSLDANFRWSYAYLLTTTFDLQIQTDGKILFAGSMGFRIQGNTLPHDLYRMNPNGTVETRFNLPASKFVAQADGKIVAQIYDQPTQTHRLKRVFAAGGADDTFNFILGGGRANKLLLQADGKILLAGRFRTINGVRQSALARLNP